MRARRGLRTRPVAEVRTCTRARGLGARPVAEVQTCARPRPMSAPRCGGAAGVRIRARGVGADLRTFVRARRPRSAPAVRRCARARAPQVT